MIPVGRLGTPPELAAPPRFLASDEFNKLRSAASCWWTAGNAR